MSYDDDKWEEWRQWKKRQSGPAHQRYLREMNNPLKQGFKGKKPKHQMGSVIVWVAIIIAVWGVLKLMK